MEEQINCLQIYWTAPSASQGGVQFYSIIQKNFRLLFSFLILTFLHYPMIKLIEIVLPKYILLITNKEASDDKFLNKIFLLFLVN